TGATTAGGASTTKTGPSQPADLTSAGYSNLNTRGYRLMLSGHYDAALPLLQHAVVGLDDPANPVTGYANFNLGQTLVRLGRCDEALPYLERASHLEPTSSEAQSALVYARSCAGESPPPAAAAGPPGHAGGPGPGHGRGHGHGSHD
ncbi:MAG TPA: tetratricopeptide repeat protein, partial [Acidimicrobiales bacterium]|nr:tetratricopeptide repeat protein [Acidimicrobiales bacterium]